MGLSDTDKWAEILNVFTSNILFSWQLSNGGNFTANRQMTQLDDDWHTRGHITQSCFVKNKRQETNLTEKKETRAPIPCLAEPLTITDKLSVSPWSSTDKFIVVGKSRTITLEVCRSLTFLSASDPKAEKVLACVANVPIRAKNFVHFLTARKSGRSWALRSYGNACYTGLKSHSKSPLFPLRPFSAWVRKRDGIGDDFMKSQLKMSLVPFKLL